jgi:hypothetical protein
MENEKKSLQASVQRLESEREKQAKYSDEL